MIRWIKKWFRLVYYEECPRCGCTRLEDKKCIRCGFVRGYDGYTDHMARPHSFTGKVTPDYTKLGTGS